MPSLYYCLSVRAGCLLTSLWSFLYSLSNIAIASHHISELSALQQTNQTEIFSSATTSFNFLYKVYHKTDLIIHLLILLVNIGVLLSSPGLVLAVLKNIPWLSLPWLLSTLASIICDVTTDIWLLKKAVLTPECSFLLTVELFIVMLQIYSVYCVLQLSSPPPPHLSAGSKVLAGDNKLSIKYHPRMELSRILEESSENTPREAEEMQRKMSSTHEQVLHYPKLKRISLLGNIKTTEV